MSTAFSTSCLMEKGNDDDFNYKFTRNSKENILAFKTYLSSKEENLG